MNEQRVVNAKVVGNKGNIWNKILLAIVLVCVGAAGMYAVMKLNPGTTVVNKLEKEVTVNENGIADAVEKVYNSVVVVENYRSNKLQATGTGFIFKKDGNKYHQFIYNYPSIWIYFLFSISFLGSFLGTTNFKVPFLNEALTSSASISSPT